MGMFLSKNQKRREQAARNNAESSNAIYEVQQDEDERPFKCPHCEAAYKEQGYLDSHIAKKHSEI